MDKPILAVVAVACARFLVEPERSFAAELLTDEPAAVAEAPIDLTGEPVLTPSLVD